MSTTKTDAHRTCRRVCDNTMQLCHPPQPDITLQLEAVDTTVGITINLEELQDKEETAVREEFKNCGTG